MDHQNISQALLWSKLNLYKRSYIALLHIATQPELHKKSWAEKAKIIGMISVIFWVMTLDNVQLKMTLAFREKINSDKKSIYKDHVTTQFSFEKQPKKLESKASHRTHWSSFSIPKGLGLADRIVTSHSSREVDIQQGRKFELSPAP